MALPQCLRQVPYPTFVLVRGVLGKGLYHKEVHAPQSEGYCQCFERSGEVYSKFCLLISERSKFLVISSDGGNLKKHLEEGRDEVEYN